MSIIYINPYRFVAAAYDADAQAYITAVEAADGQSLETAVKNAINAFFVGCKADGTFSALKASCILAGARTLSGALVPLVSTMPAPTNFNFVAGDYNRKTGLKGDGSTRYLNTNRNNNADPQDNKHLAVRKEEDTTGSNGGLIGSPVVTTGASWIFDSFFGPSDTIRVNSSPSVGSLQFSSTGFIGASRSGSANINYRFAGTTVTVSSASQTPDNGAIDIFRAAGNQHSNARISFYSIGESLNLALLDARVSTLMSALAAAIP